MTAHDRNVSDAPVARTDTAPDIPVTHARRDTATVIVWRVSTDTVSDDDSAENPDVDVSPLTSRLARDAGDSPLTSRLARYLVAIYSDVHGTVIDFDADAQLRHAAETTGRHYRAVTDPHGLTTTPDQSQPATLITLRWPRPAPNAPGHDASSLLSACQQHLAHDGSHRCRYRHRSRRRQLQRTRTGPATRRAGRRPAASVRHRRARRRRRPRRLHLRHCPRHDAAEPRQRLRHPATGHRHHAHDLRSAGETAVTPDDTDLGGARQSRRRSPVPLDAASGQRDTEVSRGDRDDRPTRQANESRYAAALTAVPPSALWSHAAHRTTDTTALPGQTNRKINARDQRQLFRRGSP
jgi:hypothetical protein